MEINTWEPTHGKRYGRSWKLNICNMLSDHCHRVSTQLQSINIIINNYYY
jgi:hypothetical protein